MAASKTTLKANIKQAFISEYIGDLSVEQTAAIDNIAGKIADEVADFVDDYVKTSTVTALLVAPNGPVTGTISIDGTVIN